MTAERLARIRTVFEQALAQPAGQRADFLRDACAGDAALLAEVESLLEHDRHAAADFLTPGPGAAARHDVLAPTRAAAPGSAETPRAARPELDGYELICEAGHGGMGVVYQARDTRLDRMVAVKTVLGEFHSQEELRLLRREAQMAARLRHQNIVAVFALIETCTPPCVVMEWVDGVPLDAVARRLSPRDTAALLVKVARAVAYAHGMGIVHRDLKPRNILVDRAGEPHLLDFGLARATRAGDAPSAALVQGTPLYMAPEQVLAPAEVGPATDTYALGLVLYSMLTGADPPPPSGALDAPGWTPRELPLPRQANPDIPEALQRICLKACETRPEDRYATAGHLADDLQRFLDGRHVHARPTRYTRLIEERVLAHVEALGQWEQEQLINRREADSLQDRYLRLLRTDSLWVPGARRLRAGTVLIQVGGWLVVLAAVLWATIYWPDLTRRQRVLSIGFPTVIINGAAAILWRRSTQLIALLFTVTGTLLLPLFALVLMSELDVLTARAGGDYEWLSADYFTNGQLVAAFWLTAAYAGALLWRRRYALLSAALCLMILLAVTATLSLFGLRDWIDEELFATTAAIFSPVPLLAYLAGRRLDRPGQDQLAVPFYGVAGIGFLIVLGVLAYDAPRSWWNLPETAESGRHPVWIARELLMLAGGLICLALAWLHDRAGTRLRRLWGALYYRVVPPGLVIPVHLLAEEPLWPIVPNLGREDLRLLELAVPVLCVLLIILGTRLQLRWFAYYGLLHLAVFIVLSSERHFKDYLGWPVVVIIVGALTILVGLWLEHKRLGLQRTQAA